MTEDQTQPTGQDAGERAGVAGRRRRHVWRALSLCGGAAISFVIVLAVLVALTVAHERPLVAPGWVKARLQDTLDRSLDGLDIDFAEVALVVEEGWRPRIQLRDLQVNRAGSDARLTLSTIAGTLAVAPLLKGEVRPDNIYLSGAQMHLRREADGQFNLALGEAGAAMAAGQLARTEGGSPLGALADEVEALMDLPDLQALRRVEATALTLRYEDARSGRAWTVDGGRAVLERDGDDLQLRGDFALLGGRAWATTLAVSYSSRIGDRAAQFGMQFEDMAAADLATQSAALAWLEVLEAPASGALRASVDGEGRLGPLNATLQIGKGVLRPENGTQPIPFDAATSYFTYDPQTQALRVDDFRIDSDYLTARAEGSVRLIGTEQGRPVEMVGQLRMTEFSAQPGDLVPEPVVFSDVRGDFRLRLDPFELTVGQLVLGLNDENATLSAQVRAAPEGWDVTAEGAMSRLTKPQLVALWPEPLAAKTRAWVDEFMYAADLHTIQFGLRLEPQQKPDIYLGFEYDDASFSFARGMPPAEGVKGHATLDRNRFVAVAEAGHVTAPQGGRVSMAGTVFVVPDTKIKPAPAEVQLHTDGTITASLALLDMEPYRFISKAGMPVTLADGRLKTDGLLQFPLKKKKTPEEFVVTVDGTVIGMHSDTLVPERRISARQLDMRLADNLLSIEGEARIGAVPVGGRLETRIGKAGDGSARLAGWVELSERFVDEFRIGLPPGSLQGQGRAEIQVDVPKGQPPAFRMSTDFAGVGLSLPDINWSLPRAARGTLTLAGTMEKPMRIDRIAVEAPGLTASGEIALSEEGGLKSAAFDRVQIGGWFDAPVTMSGRGKGVTPAVQVTGGTVDLRRAKLGGGSGKGGPLSLHLSRLQVSDTIALTEFRGEFDSSGGMNGDFVGLVNGAAAVHGQVMPRNGRSALRLTASDAGRVLAASGMLEQGRDGAMELVLNPVGPAGHYDGQLRVNGLRIIDAPAMAALLNAISVVGLVEQMAGGGILFNDVDARFRLTPNQVVIAESSAVGASLGLSMDGVYDFSRGVMDMQGVVSPIYMLNGIGSVLTRKGEGLFGFNYTLRGAAAAPSVGVNPLSLLTPGMFREIFRRPPPRYPRPRPSEAFRFRFRPAGAADRHSARAAPFVGAPPRGAGRCHHRRDRARPDRLAASR
ncbi:hypothetical protein [Pseudooceanicola sp. LIPI14-2-Ac024]|uniref:hypothetical protein n=1 Tax=Pseudooceanicola sp. LIPI14-2-Ac024 TaxID=3344875 RepID=UPI0035CFD4BA